jgi:hypothetical protein
LETPKKTTPSDWSVDMTYAAPNDSRGDVGRQVTPTVSVGGPRHWKIPCPTCGAAVDAPCVLDTRINEQFYVHSERWRRFPDVEHLFVPYEPLKSMSPPSYGFPYERILSNEVVAPTGLRLRRAVVAVAAKNRAMGFRDDDGSVLLGCEPVVQELWARVADAAMEPGTREERADRAGRTRDELEKRVGEGAMARFTGLWLQVVDAVALVE